MSDNNLGKAIEANVRYEQEAKSGITLKAWITEEGIPYGIRLLPIGNQKPDPGVAVLAVVNCAALLCRQFGIPKEMLTEAVDELEDIASVSAVDTTSGAKN